MTTGLVKWLGLIACFWFVAGCTSTSILGSWKNPQFTDKLSKVYVLGISQEETTRRIFEDRFKEKLEALGVTAFVSYKDLPISKDTDKSVVSNKATNSGASSLLIARATGKRTEQVVEPGRVSSYNYAPGYYPRGGYYPQPYYHNYGSYYYRSWDMVYEPATVTQYQVVTIEANLFDIQTEEIIWSAQLETIVDNNLGKLISGFVETVVQDLKAQGLI